MMTDTDSLISNGGMRGKTAVITGAGAGIGLETAKGLARLGAHLILVEIDAVRGAAAVQEVTRFGSRPHLVTANLAEQGEAHRAAKEILSVAQGIQVLVNNAGALFEKRLTTGDGLEKTFALNHMAYFLMTLLLLPRLRSSAPARIVCVSSAAHHRAQLDFADLQFSVGYSSRDAYFRTKLANLLFARALAKRLQGSGITVNCADPGPVGSHFFDNVPGWSAPSWIQTPEDGAKTSIYLASSPEVASISGEFYHKMVPAEVSSFAHDDTAAEKLWTQSLQLLRIDHLDCVAASLNWPAADQRVETEIRT